jgi:hypothetical protein
MLGNGHVRFGGAGRGNLRRGTAAWRPVPTLLQPLDAVETADFYEIVVERHR